MNNEWLKSKVKEELEVEYKQKLDKVCKHYDKSMEEACEEAYQICLEYKKKYEDEKAKNDEFEVKMYNEFEQKLADYKQFVKGNMMKIFNQMLSYRAEKEYAEKQVNEALGL